METPPPYLVGQLGVDHLVEQLNSSSHPFKVLQDFQDAAGLRQRKAAQICLPLLDLHGLPRRDVYQSIMQRLRERLIKELETKEQPLLATMLDETFIYIGFEEIRPVAFEIMKRIDPIPVRYLRQLSADDALYAGCPIEVKRQVWMSNEEKFRDAVIPIFNDYIDDPDLASLDNEMLVDPLYPPPAPNKRRKMNKPLEELIAMIGSSLRLYNMMMHFIRSFFAATNNQRFCTLRNDILMALHDAGTSEIVDFDPCHKFAWCLDACVRDNTVESRRIKEMQSYFDTIPEGKPIVGDLAMIVANPFVVHTLLRNIYQNLVGIVKRKAIPKDDETLWYTTHLLSFSLKARDILVKQEFVFPETETEIVHKFYPILAFMIVENDPVQTTPREIDPNLKVFCNKSRLARKITLYYLLTRVQAKDYIFVEQMLEAIGAIDITDEESFVQSLVTELISAKNAMLRLAVFDHFLLKHKFDSLFIHRQLVRFLIESHLRVQVKDVMEYLEQMVPLDQNLSPTAKKKVSEVYELLLSRAGKRFNARNAPFLFAFLDKLPPFESDEGSEHGTPMHLDAASPGSISTPERTSRHSPHRSPHHSPRHSRVERFEEDRRRQMRYGQQRSPSSESTPERVQPEEKPRFSPRAGSGSDSNHSSPLQDDKEETVMDESSASLPSEQQTNKDHSPTTNGASPHHQQEEQQQEQQQQQQEQQQQEEAQVQPQPPEVSHEGQPIFPMDDAI